MARQGGSQGSSDKVPERFDEPRLPARADGAIGSTEITSARFNGIGGPHAVVVPATVGWRANKSTGYFSDKTGLVMIDPIDAGLHLFIIYWKGVAGTVVPMNVPPGGAEKQLTLKPRDPGDASNLDVDAKVRVEQGGTAIVVTLHNNGDQPYTLSEHDLQLVSLTRRGLPPASQQHAGLVIPAHGTAHAHVGLVGVFVARHLVVSKAPRSSMRKGGPVPRRQDMDTTG